MTAEDDGPEMSREELQRLWETERVRAAVTAGDMLRALDLGEAVGAGDFDKVQEIVVSAEVSGETIADGMARTRNLLLVYLNYSIPLDTATIGQVRKRIVDDELTGMAGDDLGD